LTRRYVRGAAVVAHISALDLLLCAAALALRSAGRVCCSARSSSGASADFGFGDVVAGIYAAVLSDQ
jgi:hypothetical protein